MKDFLAATILFLIFLFILVPALGSLSSCPRYYSDYMINGLKFVSFVAGLLFLFWLLNWSLLQLGLITATGA